MSKNKLKPKRSRSQKVIIPKGCVNPSEETIIEIPMQMRKKPTVIAKKTDARSTTSFKTTTVEPSTLVPGGSDREPSKPLEFNESPSELKPKKKRSHSRLRAGPSHSKYIDYADDDDIEQLLEDLDRYYYSQKKMLLKARLSRASCGCPSKNQPSSENSDPRGVPVDIRNPNIMRYSRPDEPWKSKTQEFNPDDRNPNIMRYSRPDEPWKSKTQQFNPDDRAFSSRLPIRGETEIPLNTARSDYFPAAQSHFPTSGIVAPKDRKYDKLLNSRKVFGKEAEKLRKILNELEPGHFKSKTEYRLKAENLRRRLKTLYEADMSRDDRANQEEEVIDFTNFYEA